MDRYLVTGVLTVSLLAGQAGLAEEVVQRELGNIVTEDIPDIPPRITERLRQYQNTRSATVQGWDSDGTGLYIVTRFGETNQIHQVRQAGGARHQLTFFDEPVGEVAVSPARRELLFSKDVGGSEFYQIFHFDPAAGGHRLLTDGASRNGEIYWSNDGSQFVYYSTRRNGRDWDLYVATAAAPDEPRRVLEEGGIWAALDWSPDDRELLVQKYISINESYIYVLDLANGALTPVNPSEAKIGYGHALWDADGEHVFFTADEDADVRHLVRYDPRSDTAQVLTGDIPWDIDEIALSRDRRRLAAVANEDGLGKLYLFDTRNLRRRPVPGLPVGQAYRLAFSPDGKRLAMVINTPKSPGDTYVLALDGLRLERWTYSEVGGLDSERFAVPELIHYPTFDESDGRARQIPAFYYRPEGEGPHPVIVRIHGGPEGQSLPVFSYSVQYYVNELGAAVLLPNVRGSAGYGKQYLTLDNGYRREDSVRDIGALLEWIDERPELDADRVAVRGGSYGGYMVLASMIHFDQRLRCGVDIVGISNFVTFLENTQEYRQDLRRPEYGDERDPEMRAFLESISPTRHAGKITKPMLIAQGLNDPRVPASESEQMVREMRANGQDVWYLLALDEGHGFDKKRNLDYYLSVEALFLEQCLLGETGAAAAGASE